MENAVEVKNLTRTYNLYKNHKERIKSVFLPNKDFKKFYALNGVSVNVKPGESLGLIGINGSGKSTLANIIAGLSPQTSGEVKTSGKISLLSISAGLDNELTGKENIELKCLMLGLSKKEIKELEPDIIDFSELGDFIDQPVKNYSSGMRSRLGFSISVSLDPDIFIIDEALSVGDKAFAEKCLNKMEEFKRKGKSMIFVSHSIPQMKRFCDRILWLETGRVKAIGKSEQVLNHYEVFLNFWTKLSEIEKKEYKLIAPNVTLRKEIENDDLTLYDLNTDNDKFKWINKNIENKKSTNKDLKQTIVSLLCHIKNENAKVYNDIKNRDDYQLAKNFMRHSYFVKKKISFEDNEYFLLSKKESFKEDVIGWINKDSLTYLTFSHVSNDTYKLILDGNGIATSTPWGGGNEIIFNDLNNYKDTQINVERTVLIGKNTWVYGTLNNKKVWMNTRYTYNEDT